MRQGLQEVLPPSLPSFSPGLLLALHPRGNPCQEHSWVLSYPSGMGGTRGGKLEPCWSSPPLQPPRAPFCFAPGALPAGLLLCDVWLCLTFTVLAGPMCCSV